MLQAATLLQAGMMDGVRRSAFAGTWYPDDPAMLRKEVAGFLGGAESASVGGRLIGLISPHAGLTYSGSVAATGYALLRGCSDLTVVLIGPSHRAYFEGVAVYARGAFETPLGRVPIDEPFAEKLVAASPVVRAWSEPHSHEHCLEMQLPFLQYLVEGLRIVPAMMGSQRRGEVDSLARALVAACADAQKVLLVASSDLSHFESAAIAHALDAKVVADIELYDPDALMDRLEVSPHHACGGGPIVAVLKAAQSLGANQSRVLRYGDSGDAGNRDKSRVVGYLSAALVEQ
jgi:hypothetical protein